MGTLRQKMMELLREGPLDALDMSQLLSIREKEVYEHLPHIKKSVETSGEIFVVSPYACLHCGYIFRDRKRLNRPGKCPQCGEGSIQMASYQIKGS